MVRPGRRRRPAGPARVLWFAVRPRLDAVDWPWRVGADPLPAEMDEARERAAWTAAYGRVWSVATLEKVVLVGLISVIYAEVLPGLDASGLSLFLGLAVFVVVNAGLALWAARAAAPSSRLRRLRRARRGQQRPGAGR